MQVIPGSSCSVVEEAKDLKPLSVRLLRYNVGSSLRGRVAVRRWTRHPLEHSAERAGRTSMLRRGRSRQPSGRSGMPVSRVARACQARASDLLVGVRDVRELAPDQRQEQRGPDEREPERRGHAPDARRSAPPTRGAHHQPAVDADHVDARHPALELGRHRALPDRARGRAPDEARARRRRRRSPAPPPARCSRPAPRWVRVSMVSPTRMIVAEADVPFEPVVRRGAGQAADGADAVVSRPKPTGPSRALDRVEHQHRPGGAARDVERRRSSG